MGHSDHKQQGIAATEAATYAMMSVSLTCFHAILPIAYQQLPALLHPLLLVAAHELQLATTGCNRDTLSALNTLPGCMVP